MKKIFFKTLTFSALVILASCAKTSESCFTVDKDKANVKVNEEVHFSPTCSKEADSYQWDFGDGSSTGDATPKHKYTTKGSYVVKLTASNKSNSSVSTQTVVVN